MKRSQANMKKYVKGKQETHLNSLVHSLSLLPQRANIWEADRWMGEGENQDRLDGSQKKNALSFGHELGCYVLEW